MGYYVYVLAGTISTVRAFCYSYCNEFSTSTKVTTGKKMGEGDYF